MIDLKQLREDPQRFKRGASDKNITVDIDELIHLDEQRRKLISQQESKKAEQRKISKEIGPQIGKLRGSLKNASERDRPAIEAEIKTLETVPSTLKTEIQIWRLGRANS